MRARPEEKCDSTSRKRPAPAAFSPLAEGDYHARLAASSGIAVVLFSAPQCSACRTWKKLLPQALADVAGAFHEVDVGEATGVARCFDIFHLPTIYLYRDGRFHAELQCAAQCAAVRRAAQRLLAASAQDEP
ncbi:MAG: thiol reductase thioredoxin [Hydrogenophilales bacterium 17-64-11]|nr:MAG: thiol reductase thioredoxin [Hydrogenophilales bacterium 17-64-11]